VLINNYNIVGYSIGGYWCLLMIIILLAILLVLINDYNIVGYSIGGY